MFIKYRKPYSANNLQMVNTLYCREFLIRKYFSKKAGKEVCELAVDVFHQDRHSIASLCVRDDESTLLAIFDELVTAIQTEEKVFDLTAFSEDA